MRNDDWVKLNTGDHVRETDGRHVGRVEAIMHYRVKVRWLESRWFSWLDLDDVVKVQK